jgi:hypothetical protein
VGMPEGKGPLGRPSCRWVNNIMMDLGETKWGSIDWIDLTHDGNQWSVIMNMVMNFQIL